MTTPPPNAIRPSGEGDRTPEFKDKRTQLIGNVDAWLSGIAAKRDAGQQL